MLHCTFVSVTGKTSRYSNLSTYLRRSGMWRFILQGLYQVAWFFVLSSYLKAILSIWNFRIVNCPSCVAGKTSKREWGSSTIFFSNVPRAPVKYTRSWNTRGPLSDRSWTRMIFVSPPQTLRGMNVTRKLHFWLVCASEWERRRRISGSETCEEAQVCLTWAILSLAALHCHLLLVLKPALLSVVM